MNRQNFQQTGGFPLTTNTLSFAQASWLLMQEFGHMAGDLTILSGCESTGTQVSDGVVFINGEILPFAGGQLGTKVVVQETRSQKQFEDGAARDVEIVRTAKFGNGVTTYLWEDFTRLMPIRELQKALTPLGLIAMWSGHVDEIPNGWALCNGEGGFENGYGDYQVVPDLTDKFVRGVNEAADNMGELGGSDERTLQMVNMPPHGHSGNAQSGALSFKYKKAVTGRGFKTGADDYPLMSNVDAWTDPQNFNIAMTTSTVGGLDGEAKPFDNRPAFYTLAFIIYTG